SHECGAGPGHEPLAAEETAAALSALELGAVVELAQEVDELRQLLARREELEGRAGEHAREAFDALERDAHKRPATPTRMRGDVARDARKVLVDVDWAAEGDDRRDVFRSEVGGRLVGE